MKYHKLQLKSMLIIYIIVYGANIPEDIMKHNGMSNRLPVIPFNQGTNYHSYKMLGVSPN